MPPRPASASMRWPANVEPMFTSRGMPLSAAFDRLAATGASTLGCTKRAHTMSERPPNVLYLHSHDTGQYVEPYGYAVTTPNIVHLANQGVVFRRAFCVVPTCSGSRACLL